MKDTDNRKYEDILHLAHPRSASRPHMSAHDRAAQFSPFAALSGYEEAVEETGRLTEEKRELPEDRAARLEESLRQILAQEGPHPAVRIRYFEPDEKKSGGAYRTVFGHIRRIDTYRRGLTLEEGLFIPFDDMDEIYGT